MLRLSLRSMLARKGRMVLTALAVIAGTAFLSGVFIFTDTMRGEFDAVFGNAYAKTSAYVRSVHTIDTDFDADLRERIPDSVVEQVAAVPGVAEAEGGVTAIATISIGDKVIGQDGPPKFGASWNVSSASPFGLVEGTAPSGPDEVVIDRGSQRAGKLHVGDRVTVTTLRGAREFTVVGVVTFAGSDSTLGATWALFDLPTAQEFVTGEPGKIDGVFVRGDGSISDEALAERIGAALHDDSLEAITGAQLTAESQDQVAEALDALLIFLTIFALISLFVGSFIIFNVFSISAAQRVQENALLRAIGARRAQVTAAMFIEAVVIGLIGSVIGCIGGIGLATGVLRFLTAAGFLPGGTGLTLAARGFAITIVVGTLVTVACAVVPAIRAGRVPPLAAMRDVAVDRADVSRTRLVTGLVALVAAVAFIAWGLSGPREMLGVGSGLVFLTLIVVGPLVARPFCALVGPVFARISPVAGRLAARNAQRNPKRTALTAVAAAIVVGLIVTVATIGSSAKASVREIFEDSVVADFTVSGRQSQLGIPSTLVTEISAIDGVDALAVAVTPVEFTGGDDPEPQSARATVLDGPAAARVLDLPFVAGSFDDLRADTMLVSATQAARHDIALGDEFRVRLPNGTTRAVTVAGIVDNKLLGARVLSRDLFTEGDQLLFDLAVFVHASGPVNRVHDALDTIVEQYPTAQVQSRSEYIADQSKQIDGFLNFIYGLLGMSLFIAVIGIAITLLLAVYERRREIGLTRAVGMTRRQVRASVVLESLLTSLLGVILGVILGLVLGWIVFRVLKEEGFTAYELPVTWIVATVVGSVVLALVAALVPARRAARADVLAAIATT